jgi:hypothetical protein
VSTVQGLRTTTNWGMSSSPPVGATHNVVKFKLSKGRTATRWMRGQGRARTEIAKCVLELVDELYEVLVHGVHLRFLCNSDGFKC